MCVRACVCSLAVEPQYPQLCIRQSDTDKARMCSAAMSAQTSDEAVLSPMELSAVLNSLPCSLTFNADDQLNVIQTLVALVSTILTRFMIYANVCKHLISGFHLTAVCLLRIYTVL